MIILFFLFAVLFFILAWRRLDWAVMFLIAATPSYLIRFSIFGLPSTLLEIMVWIVFAAWFLKNFRSINENLKLKIKRSPGASGRYPFDWEIILLLVAALASAGVAGFSDNSLGIWKAYFFDPALLFIVAFNAMRGEKDIEKILLALSIGAAAVSALAIYQKITGNLISNPVWAQEDTRRVVSFFGYPNAVGLYLGPIVLIMSGWLASAVVYFRLNKIKVFFIGLTIIASVLSIYFSKSKGALIGVAAGLIIFGLSANKKIRRMIIIALIIIGVGAAVCELVGNSMIKNMALTNLSGQIRKAVWSDSWKMLKDGRLITGAGLANFQNAVKPYHQEGIFVKNNDPDFQRKVVFNEEYRKKVWQPLEIYLYPHNILLNFWSELGLVGLLLFLWIIGKFFCIGKSYLVIAASEPQSRSEIGGEIWIPGQARNDRENYKFLTIGLICAMIAIIAHGMVDVPYFKNDLAVMFWLLICMMGMLKLGKYNRYNNTYCCHSRESGNPLVK